MEGSLALTVADQAPAHDDLSRLIQWYSEAEDAQREARERAERDRDYYDNKQLTEAEVRKLQARGQPPIAFNVIRDRVSFLAGMEKKQRRDPKAYPRNNPEDVQAAEAFTDGIRYVVDSADYPTKRSQAWDNLILEGFGGLELAAVQKKNGWEFTISRIPWDRAFYDPHSSEPDFSDARYLGQVLWMDYDEALKRATGGGMDEKKAREVLDACLSMGPAPSSETYEDKPRWKTWADNKRKRVRIVMMWHREASGWKYCEFTGSGYLVRMDGPYVDPEGETWCPWIFESANIDRENNRYGEIRHLIDPQDEINKRRSKALHQAVSRGVIAEAGAVEDINKTRRELTRPDFFIELAPGIERFEIVDGQQLSQGQFALLQDAMNYVANVGPNQALMGKGVEDQSGRAIEAQQAGGLVVQSNLMDTLRRLDWRVFRAIAFLIKQYWDAPKWVRVTDDDDAPKWVGLNEPLWTDPMTGQTAPDSEWRKLAQSGAEFGPLEPVIDPQTGQQARHNDVAALDMDIIVSDAPDTITRSAEWKQGVMQLLASGAPPERLKFAIEIEDTIPSKVKRRLIEMLDEAGSQPPPPEAVDAMRLQKEKLEADIADKRASAYSKLTQGEERMAKVGMTMPLPDVSAGLTDEPVAPQGPPMGGPQPPRGMELPPEMQGPLPGMPEPPPAGPPVGPGMGDMMTQRMVA